MRWAEFGCYYNFLKKNQGNKLNNETPAVQNASSSNENQRIIRNLEDASTIQSEQQSMDIDKETGNAGENIDDPHSRLHVDKDPQADILAMQDLVNIGYSLLKQKRKDEEQETNSEPKRRKAPSLRRSVLIAQTNKKYLSLTGGISNLSNESKHYQSVFKNFQGKKSRIANDGKEENRKYSRGTLGTKSRSQYKSHLKPAPPNQSKKAETANKKQPSTSENSTFESTISHLIDTNLSPKRSGKEVWEHFKWFLQSNKESFDEVIKDSKSRDNMGIPCYENPYLKLATKTATESTRQNMLENVTTETEFVTTECQGSLKSEISTTGSFNSVLVTKLLQTLRFCAIRDIKQVIVQMREKMSARSEKSEYPLTKDLKTKYLGNSDLLCDYEFFLKLMKRQKIFSNLPNVTQLTDLPLSATHILTFYLLFLYLHQSLSSEVPKENIFKRINSENCVLAYKKYREVKTLHNDRKKSAGNVAVSLVDLFIVYLMECRSEMKSEIPYSENMSLEDYQSYFKNLRIAINQNLKCLKLLLEKGSSTISQVDIYLNESQRVAILSLFFLDYKRPDIFS